MNRPSPLTSLRTAGLLVAAVLLLGTRTAVAQMAEDLIPPDRNFASPERFNIEFHAGPFSPGLQEFQNFFADDKGPMLELELGVIAYKVPDLIDFSLDAGLGYAVFTGQAVERGTQNRIDEETELSLVPLSLLAVARIDALPRKLSVPVILTGKLGYSWIFWSSTKGAVDSGNDISHGLRWAAQVALDLDTFEPAVARAMDEEWGINHAFLFFELWGFKAVGDSLKLNDFTWSAGLGFNF